LPEVPLEHFTDKLSAMKALVKKAGYKGTYDSVKDKLELERYQTSQVGLEISEYLQM